MNPLTHLAVGLFFGCWFSNKQYIFLLFISLSLLSDVDWFTRYHRALFHNVFFLTALLPFAIIHPLLPLPAILHVLMDKLNPRGVKLFWPISQRTLKGKIPWDGREEKILRAFLFVMSAVKTNLVSFSLLLILAFMSILF